MRLLKLPIKEKSIQFSIEIFENKDVAIIAMQYSKTQFELEKLYSVGMSGLEKAKMNYGYGTDKFIRFSMWWVRQSILKYSKENFTT